MVTMPAVLFGQRKATSQKDNIDNLSVLDPQINPDLLNTLTGDFIFLGLNIARRIEKPFGNFHDPRPMATDFKIRSALKGTRYWGSHMTDIITDFEEKASGKMMRYLCNNRDFEHENIQILKTKQKFLVLAHPCSSLSERMLKRSQDGILATSFRLLGYRTMQTMFRQKSTELK